MNVLITPPANAILTRFGLSKGANTGSLVFGTGMALNYEVIGRSDGADKLREEVRLCLKSVEDFLATQGLDRNDIVKMTVFASEQAYMNDIKAGLQELFAPEPLPVSSFVVSGLAGNCRVELDTISVVPGGEAWESKMVFADSDASRGVDTGHLIYLSGKAAQPRPGDSIEAETLECLETIEKLLAKFGCDRRNIIKTSCYVNEESFRMPFIFEYKKFFDPGPFPSRCTVAQPLMDGRRVQIEAIALAP